MNFPPVLDQVDQAAENDLMRFLAVGMRTVAEGAQDVQPACILLIDVAMRIADDRDRHVRPDDPADFLDDLVVTGAAFQTDYIACAVQKEKHAVQLALIFFYGVLKLFQDIIERIVSDPSRARPVGEDRRDQFNVVGLKLGLQFIQIHPVGDILPGLDDEVLNFAGFGHVGVGFSDEAAD